MYLVDKRIDMLPALLGTSACAVPSVSAHFGCLWVMCVCVLHVVCVRVRVRVCVCVVVVLRVRRLSGGRVVDPVGMSIVAILRVWVWMLS